MPVTEPRTADNTHVESRRCEAPRAVSTWRLDWTKGIALVAWLALLVGYWAYTRATQTTPLATVQLLVDFLATSTLGIVVYILLYMLRPLILFPATLLTLAAGYVYGPVFGVLIVIVASNLSSMVAYLVGRFFGAGIIGKAEGTGVLSQYTDRLRRNSFETVLVLRFLFLPYDLVSYFSGFLRVHWPAFLAATVLGSIPGTISFILFGAAFEGGFTGEVPRLNTGSLLLAGSMFVLSLGLSRWFRWREARRTAQAER